MHTFTLPPITEEYRTRMQRMDARNTADYIQAAWDFNQAMSLQRSPEAGQAILDYCHDKGYCEKLTFHAWRDVSTLEARNGRRARFVVVGSFWETRFVLRGIVKEVRRGPAFSWLTNGQANKNARQIAHIAEQDSVEFPQFKEIQQRYLRLFDEVYGNATV